MIGKQERGADVKVGLSSPPRRFAVAAPEAAVSPAGRGLRILAVEDNEINLRVLTALLAQLGVEPTLVRDGRQAIEAWAAEACDLILMDVHMPLLDGLEATRAIRSRERAEGRARTPIVALTANALSDQVSECRAAGMDDFVAKPIRVGELFGAIDRCLRRPTAPPLTQTSRQA